MGRLVNQFIHYIRSFSQINMENKKNCANCRRDLDIGVDAIKVDEGVIGTKDFVPLDKPMFFCCDECLSAYYDMSNLPSVPQRMP